MKDSVFKKTIQNYYNTNKRDFPWRNTSNPYMILVSEIMLQQTQTSRVLTKYNEFIKKFPTIKKLAYATQSEVLTMWQGLGYNRRALNLKKTAELIYKNHKGVFPKEYKELMKLPGIGQSTAGALLNFSFNTPTPFIETNIRAVYLHFFFKHSTLVSDQEILTLVDRTMDTKNSKDWFYALYDYGAYLKSSLGKNKLKLHTKSKSYTKQKPFKGSNKPVAS